ncbi:MAG: sigma-70 family RNA polymerase sigma factor [Planctomycetes bacterium]|nr:sigma-70 family RNA polymerase sigma factor [Planctomycetota bacterium]
MADPTRWSIIHAAAEGDEGARGSFARWYGPAIRAYFAARWQRGPLGREIDDAAQDVFVDCFKQGGALMRANSRCPGGFRAYLHGIMRVVARRFEQRAKRRRMLLLDPSEMETLCGPDETPSHAYDRAWAEGVVREATDLYEQRARRRGAVGERRIALLHARFGDGQPIRDVAKAWDVSPVILHADYARARAEFRAMLRRVVRTHHPEDEVDAECARLVQFFSD